MPKISKKVVFLHSDRGARMFPWGAIAPSLPLAPTLVLQLFTVAYGTITYHSSYSAYDIGCTLKDGLHVVWLFPIAGVGNLFD